MTPETGKTVTGGPPREPAFDRLSPALQYQVVNHLGWSELRPVQEDAIHAILDDTNCVVIAPTAGGKTEAAILPLLARMDREDWSPASVLYIAPIRALLNNLEPRLQSLGGMVARTAFVWHGDIGPSARRRALRESVDILAITPESLEALMLSTTYSVSDVLQNVRAVVVDEVHAFAGDDRGAHLMAVLERVTRFAGRDLQRIGLSATVGNPEEICDWLSGGSQRKRRVVDHTGLAREAELEVDFVGSLGNAAIVLEKLHPGRKRLVFADSRRRVEELTQDLRKRDVETFVSHSSLAVSERRAAEQAFAEGGNCVIVATSALELGIDVGDLDHVLQIDAPTTVSAFLQRMGRTGRRPGTLPNCTFLATSDDALLQAVALLHLFERGFVEPIEPSLTAYHLLAHQLLSLSLQETGVARDRWWSWVEGAGPFQGISGLEREDLLEHMLDRDFLTEADGRLVLGSEGEKQFGRRHFQELFAVFSAPPVLRVLWGEKDLGTIDLFFLESEDWRDLTFILAGRAWTVSGVDWRRAACYVEPAEGGKAPRWHGRPRFLSFEICQAMRSVLLEDIEYEWLSKRARAVLVEIRSGYEFLRQLEVPLTPEGNRMVLWTFAGGRANTLLAHLLQDDLGSRVTANNLKITFSEEAGLSDAAILRALRSLGELSVMQLMERARTMVPVTHARLSKFQACLPPELVARLYSKTSLDPDGAFSILRSIGTREN